MPAEKSLAIVLRVVEFSETSCVVMLFTRDFGKVNALAKGARRPKSPFEAALDLLAVCRVVFLRKSSDVLDLLTEAKLERRFRAATRDLSRLYAGYYVIELLREMTDTHDPHETLFDAALGAIAALDSDGDVFATVLRFELAALRELGHLPSLQECVGCGCPVEASERVAFGYLAGGVLCPACRPGQHSVVDVTMPTLLTLRRFTREAELDTPLTQTIAAITNSTNNSTTASNNESATASATDNIANELLSAVRRRNTIAEHPVPSSIRGELRAVMNHYIANLLGRSPRLHPWLQAYATRGPEQRPRMAPPLAE
jgi:DNA repair protein RecO (recombination protein O)